jgi:copper resistance protein B
MKPVLIALGVPALAMSSGALAQHAGHTMPPAQEQDAHAGHDMGSEAALPADSHAGHEMPPATEESPDPHAGHDMSAPASQPDPHAGHAMPQEPAADPHAGHAMPGMATDDAPPVAPPPAEAFQGPEHAGTTVYDRDLFLGKRDEALIEEHGGFATGTLMIDRLEYRAQDGRDTYKWDLQGWYGGDYHKVWLKSEGDGAFGEVPDRAEVQLLYSRAINPWFNLQAGVRHDFQPDPERTHLVLGVQGLVPYWFEVDGQLFLSNKGDVTARLEAEYDQRITQKLILQPAVEFDLAAQDVPELGIGAGLSSIEAGLRLRYEFVPELAPYVGIEYERKLGETADFARAEGEDVGGWALLIGLRGWF